MPVWPKIILLGEKSFLLKLYCGFPVQPVSVQISIWLLREWWLNFRVQIRMSCHHCIQMLWKTIQKQMLYISVSQSPC